MITADPPETKEVFRQLRYLTPPETADNQMVRDAIRKAASTTPEPAPVWQGSDDMILQLAGIT